MILFNLTLTIVGLIRLVRWLSIIQEKEYRWDRLKIFIFSSKGLRELVRVVPRPSDITRSGFKRPRRTGRVIVIAVIAISYIYNLIQISDTWVRQLDYQQGADLMGSLFLLSIYILIPAFVLLAIIPTVVISSFQTNLTLLRAKRKLNQQKPMVIGITGSYGKTATKQLLAHILNEVEPVFATPKSFNTRYSVARSILKSYKSEKIAILEYGAYAKGEIAKLASWFQPTIAVITGLTSQHLGLFGTQQAIIEAKSELVTSLPRQGAVVYNALDEGVQQIVKLGVHNWQIKHHTNQEPILISCNPKMSKQAFEYVVEKSGQLTILAGKRKIVTNLIGMQYAQTVELAVTIGARLKLSEAAILHAISTFSPGDNFIQIRKTKSGGTIIDDGGTANPAGFKAALELLQQSEPKNKWLITPGIVDLGLESKSVHQKLADFSASFVQKVLYADWNGRAEFEEKFGTNCETDRELIIKHLKQMDSDVVLLIEGRMPGWINETIKSL